MIAAPGRLVHALFQYIKFSIVGVLATATHVGVFAALIELELFRPLPANVLAFCVAFGVSFVGHYYWTFTKRDSAAGIPVQSMSRFGVVALLGLGLNSLIVYVATDLLALSYIYAIGPMVVVVPLSTFLLSKYWAFRDDSAANAG